MGKTLVCLILLLSHLLLYLKGHNDGALEAHQEVLHSLPKKSEGGGYQEISELAPRFKQKKDPTSFSPASEANQESNLIKPEVGEFDTYREIASENENSPSEDDQYNFEVPNQPVEELYNFEIPTHNEDDTLERR